MQRIETAVESPYFKFSHAISHTYTIEMIKIKQNMHIMAEGNIIMETTLWQSYCLGQALVTFV